MNHKIVTYTIGKTVLMEAGFLLIPTLVAIIYREPTAPFLGSIAIAAIAGIVLMRLGESTSQKLYTKDGFMIVTFSWIALSIIGALPFYLSKTIPLYTDAFFEAVSGFTTTGASVLQDVEIVSKSILFWRSLTQWLGGMGVLVFILAVAERNPNRSINILKAEMAGARVNKIMPKAKTTASILYGIYIGLTLMEIAFLLAGGMSVYDSIVHSLGTAATGGFGIYNDSIASFSPFIKVVISVFMVLFAINFGTFFLAITGRWRAVLNSVELKWFLAIVGIATLVILVANQNVYSSFGENLRESFFQVASVSSTTAYSTVDFTTWPEISRTILLILMFIGGCEGSTACGFKVYRLMIVSHSIGNEMKRALHPRMISPVRIGGKPVSAETVSGVTAYLGMYLLVIAFGSLVLSFEPMGLETNFTAVVACLNNIGPGFAEVGPMANYATYSGLSKMVLALIMLMGRLEIYPVLLVFIRGRN